MAYIGQTPSAVPLDGSDIADDIVDSQHYAAGSIDTAHLADDQITLAKMAAGTDGNIISYDASGNPVAIATGSSGQVLTSGGAGAAPSFAAAAAGGKVLQVINSSYSTQVNSVGDTGLTATITPSATSSKVLVFASQGCARAAWSTGGVVLILYRASTILVRFEEQLALPGGGSAYQGIFTAASSTTYLDSPSSTSACVYKTTFGSTSGGMYAQYGGSTSTMTLVEIGA